MRITFLCRAGDAWIFDTAKVQWRQLEVEDKPRLWHTVCYGEDGDILVFGGCSSNILHPMTNPVRIQNLFGSCEIKGARSELFRSLKVQFFGVKIQSV